MEKESWILGTMLGLSTLAAVSVYLTLNRRYKLPPGPWAWPLVGNLPKLTGGNGIYYKALEFRQTYGDIFRLQFGVHRVFFIFGHQYVQEILCKHGDLVIKRPNWMYIPDKILKRKGIFWSNGDSWRAMQTLLKSVQEEPTVISAVQRHLAAEYDVFKAHAQDVACPYTLECLIRHASFNFLTAFLLGKRYSYDDASMVEMRKMIDDFGVSSSSANKANFLPFLAPFLRAQLQTAVRNQDYLFSRFREIMQDKSNATGSEPPSDFLQVYLSKSEAERSVDGMTELFLLPTIIDMFLGGKDTLMTSVELILMVFAKYPDVQSKCRSEINEVFGQDQVIQTQDSSKTPYTLATIKETMRMYSPVPLTPFHCSGQDIKVGEYDIPKDSILLIDCKAPSLDGQFWKDPDVFNPERFLDTNQIHEGSFIPYGTGPRYCIGKPMADTFLYTFTANVLRNFQVTTRNPEELSFECTFKAFLFPLHFDQVALKPLE